MMRFCAGEIYHIYNNANMDQLLFRSEDNYLHFIEKMKKYLIPRCKLLSWNLLPFDFNFLVYVDSRSIMPMGGNGIPMQWLTEGIRLMLSSYTKGINKQLKRKGNLFQQKTKAQRTTHLSDTSKVSDTVAWKDYSTTAFHYIHNKPIQAGLVAKLQDWPFSSFREYFIPTKNSLCDKSLAFELLDIGIDSFYSLSTSQFPEEELKYIFSAHSHAH
jgi:putative transposase